MTEPAGTSGSAGPAGPSDPAGSTGPSEPAAPALTEAFAQAARRSALGQVTPGETPTAGALLSAMGGVRGIVESILPGLGFLLVFTFTRDLFWSVAAPVAVAVVFIAIRLITRTPVAPAIAGLLGVGVSAALALLTDRPENNFVPGFIVNAVFIVLLLVSLLVRWPLVGVLAGFLTGDAVGWRRDRAKTTVATIATVIWICVFGARLAVQLPLYFAGAVEALAATKLLMGVPLYAAMLWVTWLLMRTAYGRRPADPSAKLS